MFEVSWKSEERQLAAGGDVHYNEFVVELIMAANDVSVLTPLERARLIERAAATIRAQRD